MNHDILNAHRFSSWNREQLLTSKYCACFACLARFTPVKISEWTDDEQTAVCPECQVDAVLGSACGVDLTDEFLQRMHEYWFE
ncbi:MULTISPECIES: cytoplasmic protein [unclassified Pseudomonas]|uniref:cytoplasmic protein n=1 Tax=unclassified Pseudomonas TaxID=196821 RepID=UPI0025E55F1D|nr:MULTISPECIES: cytoplasmic protein [unclassified Pseudomonas]